MQKLIEELIKKFYRMRGWEIGLTKLKLYPGPYKQGIIRTRATYCPWEEDKDFQKVYGIAKAYTKVDILRCFELWQMVEETQHLEGDIIEIGVWKGGSAGVMAYKANELNKEVKVYLCDTFEGVVKAGDSDNRYVGGEHKDTSVLIVEELIKEKLQLSNTKILMGMFPDDTGDAVTGKIRLCHIDVDVFQGAKEITKHIWNQLVVGGVIVYDDYGFSGTQGVTKFVDSQRGMKDRIVLYNINGHGVIVKIAD